MVLVNSNEFKIYELDDIESFKHRLAAKYKTIDTFLYFPIVINNKDLTNEKYNIIVYDILNEIILSATQNTSIVDLIKNIQDRTGKIKFDKGRDIVKIWLAYNNTLKIKDLDIITKNLSLIDIYFTNNIINSYWKEKIKTQTFYESLIKINIKKSNSNLDLLTIYENIVNDRISITKFEVEKVNFVITLNITNQSILEIFNYIVLNNFVPFSTTKNFYKIMKNFSPSKELKSSSDDSIILQVSQKKFIPTSFDTSNYENSIIKVDPISNNMLIEITVNTDKDNISKDEFISRTISVFKNIEISTTSIDESKVVGVFFLLGVTLDKYVFSDLAMNDSIFRKLIKIDDHDKATKIKRGLYIHFYHPSTGYINATLTEKKMIKGDLSFKSDDHDFEEGKSFIRVKISKADNTQSVDLFKKILGKLFIYYENEKENIIKYYKNFISTFGEITQSFEKQVIELKNSDEAPELFVSLYTRNCKRDRMPSVITAKQAKKLETEGKNVIKFPRDIPTDPTAFKFPMDGNSQKYYTCNNPEYKYVGLKNNKLKNSDVYPYVPCCFRLEQENKPKFLRYYKGKEIVSYEKKQNNIIKTDKILKYNQFGSLPNSLQNLFTIINSNPEYEYVRKGFYYNKNSFINAVMDAFNDEINTDLYKESDINTILEKTRLSFVNKKIVPLCRQELYDYTVDEIMILLKSDEYFDPKLFIALLEDKFDCNIFLFTRKILDGEMVLPRHLQTYYKNRNKKRCIYIYEHIGSESDHAKYPQCELIVKFNTKQSKNNVQYFFNHKEAKNIRKVYSSLRESYSLNTVINEIYLPINDKVIIKSQWIDSYGKTRRLNLVYNNQKISFIISPIQPIKVKETKSSKIHLIDTKTVMDLVKILDIKIVSQTVINNILKEINGILGNVSISIPIEATENIITNVPIKKDALSFNENENSILNKYNTNKKIARYLVEYTLWIFSMYLSNEKISDINNIDIISTFAEKYFDIIPNYEYKNIKKNFQLDSPILKNNKIIVKDKETIKRLVYVIKINIQQDEDVVRNFYKQTVIKNFYIDITDFDKHPNQIILFGEESVYKWIFENNILYKIQDEVLIGSEIPYFFKNSLIDDNVYLAQNTQTLSKASDIVMTWFTQGYNIGMYAKNIPLVTFTIYKYINSGNITKGIKFNENFSKQEVKILGYKIDKNPQYTVLLPLNK